MNIRSLINIYYRNNAIYINTGSSSVVTSSEHSYSGLNNYVTELLTCGSKFLLIQEYNRTSMIKLECVIMM